MAEVGTAWVTIIPSFRGFGQELSRQVSAQTVGVGTAAGRRVGQNISAGITKAGARTATFGKTFTRNVTLPVAGLGALSFKAFGAFDQTIRQVGVQTGLSGKQLDGMSKLALKLGADTAYSAGQAADAMLELAKGGLTAAQIKGGALAQTLTLAAAGGLDLGDAAGYLVNTLNTFGLAATDAGKVAAALAGGANASTASVQSLGLALSQVGPGAKLVGLSLNETVGALALFDNAGIKGSDAGTSLKTMLQRLSPQSAAAAATMKRLSLNFTDATGKFLPLDQVAQQLHNRMSGLTKVQQQNALVTIFGSDAYRAAAVLASGGAKGLDKMTGATRDLSAAQRLADTNMQGAKGSMQQLSGSVETTGIAFGKVLAPTVTSLAQKLTVLVNKFGALPPNTQKAILTAAGLAAAFGPLAVITGKITVGVTRTVTGLTSLGKGAKLATVALHGFGGGLAHPQSGLSGFASTSQRLGSFLSRSLVRGFRALTPVLLGAGRAFMVLGRAMFANPIGLTIVAVVALIAVGVLLYKRWKPFRELVDRVWRSLKNLAGTITRSVVTAFHGIVDAAKRAWAMLLTGWTVLQRLAAILMPIIQRIVHIIIQPIKGVIQIIRGILQVIVGVFTGNFSKIGTGIAHIIAGIVQYVIGMPVQLIRALAPLAAAFGRLALHAMATFAVALGHGAVAGLRFLTSLPGRAVRAAAALVTGLGRLGRDAIVRLWHAAAAAWAGGVAFLQSLPGRAVHAAAAIVTTLGRLGSDAIHGMLAGITNGAKNIWKWLGTLPQLMLNSMKKAGTWLSDIGKDVIQGFINGLKAMAGHIVTAIKETITDKIPHAIMKVLDMGSPSKVMAGLGEMTVLGFAQGMAGQVAAVEKQALALTNAATPPAVRTPPFSALRGVLASTPTLTPGAGGGIDVRVYIGERELADLVRVEMATRDNTYTRQLAYGRRA